ncbi:MAG: glucose-6-phosphate isomerase [Wolinella sp.]
MVEFQHFFETKFDEFELSGLLELVKRERASGVSAYYDLPFETRAVDDAREFIKNREGFLSKIRSIVIVGIGGSSLGLKAVDSLLCHLKERKDIELHFLEHTDPIAIMQSLESVRRDDSLFIAISKSGTTIETSSLLKYVLARYNLLEPENREHLLVITDSDSLLEQWARSEQVYCITIDSRVGGRFSVLSAVGIVPLALLGYDVKKILKGARSIGEPFFNKQAPHILNKALFYTKNREHFTTNVLFSYASAFREFNAWYIQLWGESLGKKNINGERTGMTPVALIGSIDQHSFLQLIAQGPCDKSVTFLGIRDSMEDSPVIPDLKMKFLEATEFVNGASFKELLDLQRESTMETVREGSVPSDLILIDRLDSHNVGALIYYYELLTSCVGVLLKINTYNQPGVEFGKRRLREKFALKEGARRLNGLEVTTLKESKKAHE